MGVSR